MPGRAPGELGVGRPVDGGQRVDADLGDAPLHDVARVEVGVARQVGPRVVVGGEAVHKHQRQRHAGLLHQGAVLFGDDIEERVVTAHAQQRFGLFEAHAGAQAAVEAQHDGLFEGRSARGGVCVERAQGGDVAHRLDGRLGEHAARAGRELAVGVDECADGGRVQLRCLHLGGDGGNGRLHGHLGQNQFFVVYH